MQSSKHPVDEVLPLGRLTALGLQHVLVMYAGAVAVPLIVGRALNRVAVSMREAANRRALQAAAASLDTERSSPR